MLDLLVKECYRGIAMDNKSQVDKNCATADTLTYKQGDKINIRDLISPFFAIMIITKTLPSWFTENSKSGVEISVFYQL